MSEAADLEREAEATRARLSDTADQLRARMSPGQMMDEMLNQFRDGDGGLMVANLRTQVRDNPMALALIGSGLAWLMMGSGSDSAGSASSSVVASSRPSSDLGETTPEGGGITDRIMGAAGSARGTVAAGLERTSEGAAGLAHNLQSAASGALGTARDTTSDLGRNARNGLLDVLEREPLIVGALGVAVGAAIGALLPATDLERQHLSSAGDALKHKASDLIDQGVSVVKEAGAEVYQAARDEADRQGILPGDEPIAGKIDAVVQAASEKATQVTERLERDNSSEPPANRV